MPAVRLSARDGLQSLAGGNEYIHKDDFNQLAKARVGLAALLSSLNGGPGRYSGGADDETDLGGGGTTYPAFTAIIADRDGVIWPAITDASKAITFAVTSGNIKLWAVPDTQAGVTPPAAIGGPADVLIICQQDTDPDPQDGLLLGTGTATASAVTAYTGEAAVVTPSGTVAADLAAHEADTANPHAVTAAQAGAQPLHANLTAFAGLSLAADRLPYANGAGTLALATLSAAGRALIDDADATAQRATLGLVIGTNVQAFDAELAAVAGVTSAASKAIRFTGSGTAEVIDWIDPVNYFSSSTVVGWTGTLSPAEIVYDVQGKVVRCNFRLSGTSNSTGITFTLPHAIGALTAPNNSLAVMVDNGVVQTQLGLIQMTGSTVTLRRTTSSADWAWTGSGTKTAYGQFSYFRA